MLPSEFTDIPDLDSMIQNLDGVTEVKTCRDGLIEIKSKQGDASTQQVLILIISNYGGGCNVT